MFMVEDSQNQERESKQPAPANADQPGLRPKTSGGPSHAADGENVIVKVEAIDLEPDSRNVLKQDEHQEPITNAAVANLDGNENAAQERKNRNESGEGKQQKETSSEGLQDSTPECKVDVTTRQQKETRLAKKKRKKQRRKRKVRKVLRRLAEALQMLD
ncbi:hypothetical protein N7539_005429 [Penicillium diatomitis]|uniref:Uncharacterized protein n=1 Tax=Penicillium diatomitis TaxID=2819901 RepID=A0A9W9X7A4_9EURO|nr:uncharacterized protein N7539_005429 [Penicillium diatomitis]KAJ5485441.1 hypothetical protein N7539_005429 [Penicillium diatomitis]